LKLGLYGEGAVGKTSLVNSFLGIEVPTDYSPTINSRVNKKLYDLKQTGVILKINLWDVGGNRAINPVINKAFFTEVDFALIIFDLTRSELTLKAYKKNFLDELNKYSEEPLILIVGNKFDRFSLNQEFKDAIQNFLGESHNFSITSVTSELNVSNCFELLIYTFLKKAEILVPDMIPENASSEFIEIVRKNEEELRGQLVNLNSITLKHQELKPKIKIVNDSQDKEDREKKYYQFIQKELETIVGQRESVADKFLENIMDVENVINHLRKQKNISGLEVVNELKLTLESSKNDCEQNLELLIRLGREENELLIISSRIKETEIDSISKAKQSIPEEEVQKIEVTPKTKLPSSEIQEIKSKVSSKAEPTLLKVKDIKVEVSPKVKPTTLNAKEIRKKDKQPPKPSTPKLKKIAIGQKPIKKDSKIELYNKYERENPGKRAVYRGRETKGFLTWKKEII
jgi:small GTP-binding protein